MKRRLVISVVVVVLAVVLLVILTEPSDSYTIRSFTVDQTSDGEPYIALVSYSWSAVHNGDLDNLYEWFREHKDEFR